MPPVPPANEEEVIQIVEREFIAGFDAMHYPEVSDIVGIQDALFARMMGWDK